MPANSSEIRALTRDLRALAPEARRRAGTAVIKAVADTKREAQLRAPVDTGALRASMSGTTTRTVAGAVGEVGPTVDYGIYVELGTSRAPGQPFLGPAFDVVEPRFMQALQGIGELQ
jgi:HK97 gp10 family phage protein